MTLGFWNMVGAFAILSALRFDNYITTQQAIAFGLGAWFAVLAFEVFHSKLLRSACLLAALMWVVTGFLRIS